MAMQSGKLRFSRHAPAPSLSNSKGSKKKGGGQTITADTSEDLSPWQPTALDPWDEKKAKHLFRRAGFGGRPDEIKTLVKIGVDRAVDLFLIVPNFTIPVQGTHFLPSGELLNLDSYSGQVAGWLYLMANSPWQLQEKMSLFFHDHYATGINKVRYTQLMGKQINLFRQTALGSFRTQLIGISADPAMLYWLDNRLSRRGRVNENYGREIMELFSMGVNGGYTENDVKAAAKAFTGWTNAFGTFYYRPSMHDTSNKVFLGRTILGRSGAAGIREGVEVVDQILRQKVTAEFMVRKIWEWFVYENPSKAFISKLAARFRADGYNFRTLMETIFRSKAFYSSRAMKKLVKNPVELVIGAIRNTRQEKQVSYLRVAIRFLNMGWPLLNFAGPDGLPDGVEWINSQNIINRSNFLAELHTNSTRGYLHTIFSGYYLSRKDWVSEVRSLGLSTPTQIVDHYLKDLLDSEVPAKVRTDLIDYMTRSDNGKFTWNLNTYGQIKISGLVYLIMNLPEYHMN